MCASVARSENGCVAPRDVTATERFGDEGEIAEFAGEVDVAFRDAGVHAAHSAYGDCGARIIVEGVVARSVVFGQACQPGRARGFEFSVLLLELRERYEYMFGYSRRLPVNKA
jgi:hypothetical protein